MRAVAVCKTGDPPKLMESPKPEPDPGEVLVRLTAAAINPMDWKIAEGQLVGQLPHAFPLILGVDGAGHVEALGEGIDRFSVGDAVFGQFFRVPVGSGGTFAEYVAVPEQSMTSVIQPVPDGIPLPAAAALPTAGMTALGALDATGLQAGQTMVIIGATGGIGCFATQLAVGRGGRVIATAQPDTREWITRLGAAETTGYEPEEIVGRARSSCPEGVDVLLDLVGNPEVFETCVAAVRDGGTALSVNFGAPAEPPARARVHMSNYILMDGKPGLLARITEEVSAGRVTVPVEDEISLDDVVSARDRKKVGGTRGKTVVHIK